MKRRPVAVTGGSGFIGSSVVDALVDAGHPVRVLDPQAPHRDDVDWRRVDVLDLDDLTKELDGSGPVFHLAAMADVNDVIAAPAQATQVNVVGTVNVLEAARRSDAGRVILASTVWVYDATRGERVDETTPFDPDTNRHLYVSTKIAAELACRDYLTLYQRPFTVLRLGIPYGPRMRDVLVVARFVRAALAGTPITIAGTGEQQRNYVFVGDIADAHVRALSPAAADQVLALEGGTPVSVREIADTVRELIRPVPVEYVPARTADYQGVGVSNRRAKEVLDWSPETSFVVGVRRYLDWLTTASAEDTGSTGSNL